MTTNLPVRTVLSVISENSENVAKAGWLELVNPEDVLREQNLAFMSVLFQLVVIPAAAGAIASTILLRRKLGRVVVQRALVQDKDGRPLWKLMARCQGKPAKGCRIHVGGNELMWEGVDAIELDIGAEGLGMAAIPFEVEPESIVSVKSGPFQIFRSSFRNLDEAYLNR